MGCMSTTPPDYVAQTSGRPKQRQALGISILALLLTIGGPMLYMALMTNSWIRASGAPAFVLMFLGSMLGIRAIARDRRLVIRGIGLLSPLLTILFAYIFFWGLKLPPSQTFDSLTIAPAFTLPDEEGRAVSLDEVVSSGPALLVFYRGYW